MSSVDAKSFTTFGELLTFVRQRARLTQQELGIAVDYSRGQVARLESGQRLPDVAIVRARFIEALHLQHEPDLASRLILLAEASHADEAADLPDAIPSARHSHLLVYLNHFIGRADEIAEVKDLLGHTRLLTMTGSGGVGKTRLACQVAAALEDAFTDGVWLAEFAPIADPELVVNVVAGSLGIRATSSDLSTILIDHLQNKNILLVLDNCEHLIHACAGLADALLRACPHLSILATSREVLNLPGEVAWRVPSLITSEAIQLFVDRGKTARPGFVLNEQNSTVVRDICARLDAMPLAIELAAARLRVMSAHDIAKGLDDRFTILTGGVRTALPRHQTLKALIDWSYSLLSEPERTLLNRLSVFAGGCTPEAAADVCADEESTLKSDSALAPAHILPLLVDLVDKSLVDVNESASPGQQPETRYRLLETIRQYADERLKARGELEIYRRRHALCFTKLAEQAESYLFSHGQIEWFNRLTREHDNLRAALGWALDAGENELAQRLYGSSERYWRECVPLEEGFRWITRARATEVPLPAFVRAKALTAAAYIAMYQGDVYESRENCTCRLWR